MARLEDTKQLLRRLSKIQLATRRLSTGLISGEYRSAFKGQGMEFDQVREYFPGDEPRQIDWNVTARFGHPYVKSFVEERALTLLFVVDCSQSTLFGSGLPKKKETIAQLMAALAFNAVQSHDKVGLLLYGESVLRYLPPKAGMHQAMRVLRDVLDAPSTKGSNLPLALKHAHRVIKGNALFVLLSDFFDLDVSQPLNMPTHRHDFLALEVLDPFEISPFHLGLLEVKDLETGEWLLVDTDHKPWQEAFRQQQQTRQKALLSFFKRYKMDHLRLTAGQPFDDALRRLFKERSKR